MLLEQATPVPKGLWRSHARFEQSVFSNDLSWALVSFATTPGNLKRQHCLLLIKDENLRNYLKFLAHVKPKSSMKRKPLPVAVCKFAMMPNKLSFASLPANHTRVLPVWAEDPTVFNNSSCLRTRMTPHTKTARRRAESTLVAAEEANIPWREQSWPADSLLLSQITSVLRVETTYICLSIFLSIPGDTGQESWGTVLTNFFT